jgi:hypothetical protein
VELVAQLEFSGDVYVGGEETYYVVERGHRVPLLRLTATLRRRTATNRPGTEQVPHQSPAAESSASKQPASG